MNHFQMLVLVAMFNLDWNYIVNRMFDTVEFVANAPTQLFSFQCFLDERGITFINSLEKGTDKQNSPRLIYKRFIIYSIAPLIITLGFVCFKFLKKRTNSGAKIHIFGNLAITFYLIHIALYRYWIVLIVYCSMIE